MRRPDRALAVCLTGAWLVGAGGAALAADLQVATRAAGEPAPHVLLITIDTLRPDALGWAGGTNETPNLDQLAGEGFRFPAAVSEVPLTLPSHTTIMTGLLPRRHGVRDNGQLLGTTPVLLAERLAERGYATGAFVSGYPLRAPFGLDRGFERYDDSLPLGAEGWLERRAPETTRAALAWLSALDRERPWFLWVHYYDPHDPYDPPRAFWRPGPRGAYDGEVAFVDESIGALRRGVQARTADERRESVGSSRAVLTVFTSDHAEGLGQHGEVGHGFFLYDTTILVPLVISFPGRVAPGLSNLAARLVDVAPTILELLSLPALAKSDGVSLAPLLAGKPMAIPPAFLENQSTWIAYGWAPLAAMRTASWKLIAAPRPELYDLGLDTAEAVNRVDSNRRQARELEGLMRQIEIVPAVESQASQDPEMLASLQALGYLGGATPPRRAPAGLADPKDRLTQRNQLSEAQRLLREGHPADAIAQFDAVLTVDPDNRFAALRSGVALAKAGNVVAAIARFERAVALDPEQVEAHYGLADALTRAGRLEAAAQQWLETVRLNPRRVAGWSNLGTVLLRLGQSSRAVGAFERALALEPENTLLRGNLGAGRYSLAVDEARAGNLDVARRRLGEALEVAPELAARAAQDSALSALLP
jgi:arylsulfatase A-like enzyme/predicted TPR repeat methyltransferase